MKAQSSAGGVDSTENSFAVFINSNQSRPPSTEKSHVFIPFNGNIADADPHKVVQISLTGMHFTNTIFNVTTDNNTLRAVFYYGAGRGKPASYESITIEVPPGFYNITQMSDFLSTRNILGHTLPQVLFQYPTGSSYCNIYEGFGALPLDPNDNIITKAAPTNNSNTKIVLQSPDLGHLIQFGTDISSVCINAASLPHSYVYEGVYLLFDESTLAPMLKMLGFFNINTIPPDVIELDIPFALSEGRKPHRGYGIRIRGTTYKKESVTQPEENVTYYSVTRDGVEIQLEDPSDTNVQFSGIIYESPPGYYLSCLFEEAPNVPGNYIQLYPGQFISGTGITVPGPYVTAQLLFKFSGDLTPGSNEITNVVIVAGTSVVGMVIANYTAFTDPSVGDLPNFDFVYSQLTPTNYYYIIGPGSSPNSYMLNQPWDAANPPFSGNLMGLIYVITTTQVATTGGLPVNMLATTEQITDVAGILTPFNVTNMSGVDEIHVHCEQLRTRNVSSVALGPLCASDVIAVVPVEVEFGFKQNYQPPNPIVSFLDNTNIVNLEMRLTDAYDRDLNFNGVDWSLTLYCQEMQKEEPSTLALEGTQNTPFQDQLVALEGTSWAQERVLRKNREITFVGNGSRKQARRLY